MFYKCTFDFKDKPRGKFLDTNKQEQTTITQMHLGKSRMAEQSRTRPRVMHCSHLSHNVIKSSRLEAIKV